MPPHILLQSTDEMKGDPRLKPAAFRPANQLPDQLPDGAHRVITEMTSAKMRKMMQGIVVEGTGKLAAAERLQLRRQDGNGAEDRSGDAYLFAHEAGGQLCGICAGEQSGDLGCGGDRYADGGQHAYGGAVERAGVCRGGAAGAGVSGRAARSAAEDEEADAAARRNVQPDDVPDESSDLSAMFDEVNSLPADDPLRQPATAAAMQQNQVADERAVAAAAKAPPPKKGLLGLPDKVLSTFHANGDTTSVMPDTNIADAQVIPLLALIRPCSLAATARWWSMRVSVLQFQSSAAPLCAP